MAAVESHEFVDAFSGLAGGMAQVLVGHPFDTVKVQLQTARYQGVVQCVRGVGLTGLYNGIWSPLLGIGLCNSVLFHTFSWSKNNLFHNHKPTYSTMCSGAIAGTAMAIVNCPVELMKVQMQTNPAKYKHIFDCASQIVKQNGPLGLFRGLTITIARDAPSFVAYFAVYEYLRDKTVNMNTFGVVVSGAAAGIAAWLPCYPQDVIKSVIQSQEKKLTITAAIKLLYNRAGYRAFWSGFGPTMARAVPANAATFLAYETVRSALS